MAQRDHTISFVQANVVAIGLFAVVAAVGLAAHLARWPERELADFAAVIEGNDFFALLLVFAGSIVLHELLHAAAFRWIGKAPRESIRFGFNWKGMAPYAATSAVMPAYAYRWSAAFPSLFLGVPQLVMGLLMGSEGTTAYGIVMLGAAGGDYAALWAMRGVPRNRLVRDSPVRVGCEEVETTTSNVTLRYDEEDK